MVSVPAHLLLWVAAAVAAAAFLAAVVAERLHAARTARVARLAFGPAGRPAAWARVAPWLRVAAVPSLAWGAVILGFHDPVVASGPPRREGSRHLLIALDASPSMQLKDAGPGPEKVSRAVRAGQVAQAILDRMDAETTRVSLVAFYSKAIPVLQETYDKEVVRNVLDGLPMYVAFEPGSTDVQAGVSKALEMARPWPRQSTVLVVLSDGDTSAGKSPLAVPDSVADVVVIGVGDPNRSTVINGHSSRQDSDSLRHLASRLKGLYHDGNLKHLPTSVLQGLSVVTPQDGLGWGLRQVAMAAATAGASVLALLGPALILAGAPGAWRRGRRGLVPGREVGIMNAGAGAPDPRMNA